jgi:hypothetical protein
MAHSGYGRFGGEKRAAKGGKVARHGAVGAVGDEVAHVRARFAVDPATPARLSDAWKAPTGVTEEDESELIDVMADCLSVGLPLDAAVASWRSGSLEISEHEDDDDDETSVFGQRDDADDDADADDTDVYDAARRTTGRRRIIET